MVLKFVEYFHGLLEFMVTSIYFYTCLCRGSAIAKIVGSNAAKYDVFDNRVTMYVYEELVNGRKLTEIINQDHENVKYLPGHKLPENVVRVKWYAK